MQAERPPWYWPAHLPCVCVPGAHHSTAIMPDAQVRSQNRMSSTSNQETFRAEVAGRVVVDVLRSVSGRWVVVSGWVGR